MLKKTLKMAGIGFLIGIVVGNLIAILTSSSHTGGITIASQQLMSLSGGNPVIAVILQSLFSGIYGATCFAGVVFYNIERMPLAAATALHCGVIIFMYILIALLLGWVGSIIELFIIAGIQIVVFFIIWLILYFSYKKQVRELNAMQQKFSSNKE